MNPALVAGFGEGGSRRGSGRGLDDGFPLAADRAMPTGAAGAAAAPTRKAWLTACKARLSQLRPTAGARAIDRLAAELWREAGRFDPAVAAEMEVESGGVENGDG